MKFWSVILLLLLAAAPATEPTTEPTPPPIPVPIPGKLHIVLVGDSTVTDKAGWGLGFAKLLKDNAQSLNMARGGRSSKSFIREGHWAKALALKGDYVLIQFGHIDQPSHPGDRETDPKTDYVRYMTQYVNEARAAGAKPILITSVSRRQWGADGKIHSTLVPYVESVKKIAAEKNVPLVDLHASSIELYEKLGKSAVDELSPRKPSGDIDNTHFNAKGSDAIAPLVVKGLRNAVPELADFFK